ncbi:phosphotransferase [Polymorphospora rubra]|uniref:phosphotransferase n=1 Tax=Polymorphospora rubra TaxID=338584 RepID=UPI0033EEE0C7
MTVPVPFASGRDADVFLLDAGTVLRRYRAGGDVAGEAAMMAHVAGYGYPVPRVVSAGGPDLVMERLDGPTLLGALAALAVTPAAGAELLADLHVRLHEIPARSSTDPADRVLHLDLHPDNVMLTTRGPVVIDWRNAVDGPPDFDVALSALILAEVAVDPAGPYAVLAREMLVAFLGAAGGRPLDLLPRAVAMRAANPTLSAAEKASLDGAAALVRAAAG